MISDLYCTSKTLKTHNKIFLSALHFEKVLYPMGENKYTPAGNEFLVRVNVHADVIDTHHRVRKGLLDPPVRKK